MVVVSELDALTFEIVRYRPEFQHAVVDLWGKCDLIVSQNDPIEDIRSKFDFQPDLFFIGLLDGRVIGSIMVG